MTGRHLYIGTKKVGFFEFQMVTIQATPMVKVAICSQIHVLSPSNTHRCSVLTGEKAGGFSQKNH